MGSYGAVTNFSGLIADINAAYNGSFKTAKLKGVPKVLPKTSPKTLWYRKTKGQT